MAGTTRDRIIEASLRLFAREGFARTTVAAIEAESGLAQGSGGLYRHFPSKRSVLEAAVAWAEANAYAPAAMDDRLFDTTHPKIALRTVAENALVATRRASDLHITLLRAGPDLPVDPVDIRDRLVIASYVQFARWLELFSRAGVFREVDYEATAASALGAVVWFHYAVVITGAPPSNIDEARFIEHWVDVQWTYLKPH